MEQGWVLNPLDIIIISVIGLGMYRGAVKGVIDRAAILLSIVISVVVSFRLRYLTNILYRDYLNVQADEQLVAFLAFATGFVIVYILISALLKVVTQGLDKMKLNINKALGALFGGVIATLLLSIVFIVGSYVNFPSPANAKGSMLYPSVKNFARVTLGLSLNVLKEASRQVNQIEINSEPLDESLPPASTRDEKPQPIR
jgi:membrane protein required for colicin V production